MRTIAGFVTFLVLVGLIQAFTLPANLLRSPTWRGHMKRKWGNGGAEEGDRRPNSGLTSSPEEAISNAGGKSRDGTGPAPLNYPGGNSYYAGGAKMPYRAGAVSPSGTEPLFMPASNLDFYPGLGFWKNGVYIYQWKSYTFRNASTHREETLPVDCLCERYKECSCDEVRQSAYIDRVANNASISHVATLNGKYTLVLDGTLPNGTAVASKAPSCKQGMSHTFVWNLVIAGTLGTAWLI